MKMTATKLVLASTISLLLSANVFAADLKTDLQKESYSVGASVGKYLSNQIYSQTEMGAAIDMDVMVEGFMDALKGKTDLTEEQVVDYLNKRGEFLNKTRDEKIAKIKQENKEKSEAFLIDNKFKDGVKVTDSGLQYEVLTLGNGVKPKPEDVVTVNYVGKLVDGTEFENSYATKQPARMAIMGVIKGWQEGLALMPEGSTFRFTIPAALAYGTEGAGPIPPESTLVFDIELLKVDVQKDKMPEGHDAMMKMAHG